MVYMESGNLFQPFLPMAETAVKKIILSWVISSRDDW